MPTYRYRCSEGHEFEVEQKITAKPLKICIEKYTDLQHDEDCHLSDNFEDEEECCTCIPYAYVIKCKGKLERLIQPTSFTLKGKGWAKDGYSKK